MAVELEVAFDNLMAAFGQLKESFLDERRRLDYIEMETMKTKATVKSAAHMILENLE